MAKTPRKLATCIIAYTHPLEVVKMQASSSDAVRPAAIHAQHAMRSNHPNCYCGYVSRLGISLLDLVKVEHIMAIAKLLPHAIRLCNPVLSFFFL